MADQSPSSGLHKAADTPAWSLQNTADGVCLNVEGAWTVQAGGATPFPQDKLPVEPGHTLHIDTTGLKGWDSAFVAFLWDVKQAASKAQLHFDEQNLPAPAQRLLALLPDAPAEPAQPHAIPKVFLHGWVMQPSKGLLKLVQ